MSWTIFLQLYAWLPYCKVMVKVKSLWTTSPYIISSVSSVNTLLTVVGVGPDKIRLTVWFCDDMHYVYSLALTNNFWWGGSVSSVNETKLLVKVINSMVFWEYKIWLSGVPKVEWLIEFTFTLCRFDEPIALFLSIVSKYWPLLVKGNVHELYVIPTPKG